MRLTEAPGQYVETGSNRKVAAVLVCIGILFALGFLLSADSDTPQEKWKKQRREIAMQTCREHPVSDMTCEQFAEAFASGTLP